MNQLSLEKRAQIVTLLAEGNSIRACSRITDTAFNTVLKMVKTIGIACEKFHNEKVINIKSDNVQCDEIWSFVHAKDKNVPKRMKYQVGFGDTYTWIAMKAKSKLVISWLSGKRDSKYATKFIRMLSRKLIGRTQLTTDGHRPYAEAIEKTFGPDINYAQILKVYKATRNEHGDRKYSADKCVASHKKVL